MPAYVQHPDNPDLTIDVMKLQAEAPLRVLPAYLLPDWLKRDTWSRREALMLLSGYNPTVTQWTEAGGGFGQFAAGNRGYLDGISDWMIQHANVSWRHPRHDEAYEQFLILSDYARGGSLEERKAPAEWIAWAAAKGLSPYWSALAQRAEAGSKAHVTIEGDHQHLRIIGHAGGFAVSASPVINGMTTVSVGPGEVIRLSLDPCG